MKHLYLKKIEGKITISNPPTSPFRKGGIKDGGNFRKEELTKEFISKTTFLSFPGLTGESRKTLDARLRTSGMTYKDVECAVINDRISKVEGTFKKEGNLSPSFLKRGEGRLLKIIYIFLIMFLILPFIGCKKEQATVIKPMAEKVKTEEVKKDIKEAEEAKKVEKEEYLYDSKGRRDPFLSLVTITKQKPTKKKGAKPIESFDLEEIKLLAIAWDKNKYYALIMLPDRKTFTITEGMILGLQGGKVEKITENMVTITEYVKDYRGNIKPKDTVLKLHKGEEE